MWLGLILGLVATVARADIEYDLVIVEPLGGSTPECYVQDINNDALACGKSTNGSFYDGFVWTLSSTTIIPLTFPEDINNHGVVVDGGGIHDTETGNTTYIGGLNDYYATPFLHGLNDAGVVVGHAKGPGSDSNGVNRAPIIWDAAGGMRGIDVPAARELVAINSSGVAVGNIRWSAGDGEAFVYDVTTGEAVNLHERLSPTGQGTSFTFDINDAGVVLGTGWNGTANHAFLWTETDGFTLLPGLDGGPTMRVNPGALNASNVVVGNARSGTLDTWRAFIWDETNGMRDLNDLVDGGDFLLDDARGINAAGWIVGNGHVGPGFNLPVGFVLVPRTVVSSLDLADATGATLQLAPGSRSVSEGAFSFAFALERAGHARLRIFDAQGRAVASLLDREFAAGSRTATWLPDASVASGVYLVRLETSAGVSSRRVVRVR